MTDPADPTASPVTAPDPAAQPKRRRWRRRLIDVAVVLAIVGAVGLWQTRHHLGGGAPAPAFALPTLTHGPLSSDALRGHRTLMVFWAPWCSVCAAMSDNVDRVAGWLGDDTRVVSVALAWRDRAAVEGYVAEHGIEAPVVLGDRAMQEAYAVSMFPTVYVIDAEGRVAHTAAGYTTTLGLWWRAL